MFIGHFAVGFASKKFAPRANLAVLIAAPLVSDILWPFFLLFGWEKVRIDPANTRFTPLDLVWFPWSHSLLMTAIWATVFAALYYAITRYRAGAWAIWIGVVSHWILDWITHRPDMPLSRKRALWPKSLELHTRHHDRRAIDVRGRPVGLRARHSRQRPHRPLRPLRVRRTALVQLHCGSFQFAAQRHRRHRMARHHRRSHPTPLGLVVRSPP